MLSDYTTSKLLVADRQARYRHEAQQDRLARLGRRRGRTTSEASTTPPPRADAQRPATDRQPPAAEPPTPGGLAAA